MFTVTEAASIEILAAAQRGQTQDMALRVAARRRDDGSVAFGMGFDDWREQDEATEVGALRVLVGASSRELLADLCLDYLEVEPGRHDFVFMPKAEVPAPAAKSCGSGGCSSCA